LPIAGSGAQRAPPRFRTHASHSMNIRTIAAIFLVGLIAAGLVGCGESGPVRAPVVGQVTVGGKPLAAGRILFTPIEPNHGPAASSRIINGEYKLSKEEGPVVGENRVEVEADLPIGFALDDEAAFAKRGKPLPPNPIPPAFNTESTLAVEIKAGDVNQYDITIPASRQSVRK
jgi:hypothetical protein